MKVQTFYSCVFAGLSSMVFAEDNPSSISSSLQRFIDDGLLSGAVTLVAQEGEILNFEAIGLADIQSMTPMQKDSLFWIASMTKPITAMAVMMLVDEGRLSIDDPVAKYLPEFRGQMLIQEKSEDRVVLIKPARPITVKDLLTHTSGLVSASPLEFVPRDRLPLKEAVYSYALSPLQFEPGSKWSYCNPGMSTLGRIVEVVSGSEFATFLDERLFGPLEMKDTTFWPSEPQIARLATAYRPDAEGKGLVPEDVYALTKPYSDQQRTAMPAGGLFSTADDLRKLYQMLLNGGERDGRRYLSIEAFRAMTSNQTGEMKAGFTDGICMGLGFQMVREPKGSTAPLSVGTYGHGGAYGTQGWIDPVKKTIQILLIQRAGLANGDASEIRRDFHQAAAQLLNK